MAETRYINPYTDFGFKTEEHFAYEESLKNMRDIDSVITSAEREGVRRGRAEGLAEGRAEGRAEGMEQGLQQGRAEGAKAEKIAIARSLKAKGLMSNAEIAELTGLSPDDVSNL